MEKDTKGDLESRLLNFFKKEGMESIYLCYAYKDDASYHSFYNLDDDELMDMILNILDSNPKIAIALSRILIELELETSFPSAGGLH